MAKGAGTAEELPRSFFLLIKPISFHCNLRCRYCFYLPKEELYGPGMHRMTRETLESATRNYLAQPLESYSFGWQGGEPTLMGTDFYREAIRLQQKYSPGDAEIGNSLQTNGTLLDDEWGKFLHEKQFLTGISIDGPAKLHDRFRKDANGRGSHSDVIRGLKVLRRHHVEFNVLTLVSASNQDHPVEVYRYLGELGIRYQQYIECVETDAEGKRKPFALSPGKWGEFLCRIFDEWYPRDVHRISIRLFDSIVSRLATGIPSVCSMGGNCCSYLVLEHNGDVYPCDFHVREALRLGNIRETDFGALRDLPCYREWGKIKEPHSQKCLDCRFLPLCMGDCPKNRRNLKSLLCEDWRVFYTHTIGRFEELASRVRFRASGEAPGLSSGNL